MSGSTRWLLAFAVLLFLVIAASAVIAILANDEDQLAAGSPEETVQRYLRALSDRDASTALSFLSPELSERCGRDAREQITRRDIRIRAVLERTVIGDSSAEVHIRITETFEAPLVLGNESSFPAVFELTRQDGSWRFTTLPWPLYCPPLPAAR
ncbi:MAG: hypothetical protein EXR43_05225 [Dehalococcoidia bacterium]|nr:hypothetical protein [Dehalococcoidia bacterium]